MAAFLEEEGERYGSFIVTKRLPIAELQTTLRHLKHEPTGATVLHLENSDSENLFSLSFRTWPKSSNGVAHVLEHLVLCGSKRFPVKDPFFSMTRRSLNTFMNAFTGSGFTCYPASSQIEKDFYNLLDVYLDAVFHPQLKKTSFRQEGWRLEFSDPQDVNTPLQHQGIVLNEMKGSFASPVTRLWHHLMKNLYSALPYAHNSGGEPIHIPDLSYEELISFYDTYYHPGNCLFFFYGNLFLKNHLDFIEERALKHVAKTPLLPPLPKEKRFAAPLILEERYPLAEDLELEKKAILAFAYLTASITEQEEVLALSLLDSVLMDTDASLLKATLLESGLCATADSLLDPELSEVPFVIVCKGCSGKDREALSKLIEKRLKEIVSQKIPREEIEASLHQLEFHRTEIVGNHIPYGLTLFMRSALALQHGCPPENALKIHSLFEGLREKLKDSNYLSSLIEKHLLNNSHRLQLTLAPSHTVLQEEIHQERLQLDKIKASLSKEEAQRIVNEANELQQYQMEKEQKQIDCLPKLSLDDVPLSATNFFLAEEEWEGIRIFHHPCFTNQILYADLLFDLPFVTDEELPYLHLLTTLLTEVGCRKRGYAENLQRIHAFTGGMDAAISLHIQVEDPRLLKPSLHLHGKALYRNARELFSLLKEMGSAPRFDEVKRIEELIAQLYTSLENRLNHDALKYAIQLSLSGFGPAPHIMNTWYGLPFYKLVQKIARNFKKELPCLLEKLNQLKKRLFSVEGPHLVLSCDAAFYQTLKAESLFGLGEIEQKPLKPWLSSFKIEEVGSHGRLISSPVAFTCQAFKTISYLHPYAPALYVATALLENKHLHRAIREQGGAYGSGAHYNSSIAAFYFHGLRDPHLYRTLNAFNRSVEIIAEGEFDANDLEEAKLGMLQGLDAPVPPGGRAILSYGRLREGKSPKVRQLFRDHLLAVSKEQILTVVEKELLHKKDQGVIIAFAGSALFEQEGKKLSKEDRPLYVLPT